MVEILIPTYNRSSDLVKNILHIDQLIKDENLRGHYSILISDNASTDNTESEFNDVIVKVDVEVRMFKQNNNIGLEKNAVFILEQASTEYVIFLGDDDFLPSGYLTKLAEIAELKQYGVVIPGFSSLFPDGEIKPSRKDFFQRSHRAGFNALVDFIGFGHQLSGLFFKRSGVITAYKLDTENRNIYLFMFFIGYVMQKESSIYLPQFQVLVSQGNSKDWGYDDSGLLTEIFKNFRSLYSHSLFKRVFLCFRIMSQQSFRLRRNSRFGQKSFVHLLKSTDIDLIIKCLLPIFYSYLCSRALVGIMKRKFHETTR